MQSATRRRARPVGPGARPARALGALALGALLLVLLAACDSSNVSRRVSFVETNGETRLDTTTITLVEGETLKLTIGNRTDTRQEFTIDGLNIERTIAPDSAVTVDIKVTQPGTYRLHSQRNPSVDPLAIIVPK